MSDYNHTQKLSAIQIITYLRCLNKKELQNIRDGKSMTREKVQRHVQI